MKRDELVRTFAEQLVDKLYNLGLSKEEIIDIAQLANNALTNIEHQAFIDGAKQAATMAVQATYWRERKVSVN